MRSFIPTFAVLFLAVIWSGSARADLLVSSFNTFQVLRYHQDTGNFLGAFATGLAGDRPLAMTGGPDGNLYVGVTNFGNPQQSFIRRFDGATGAFIDTFASDGKLHGPGELIFGRDGNLYVASFGPASESKVIRYDGMTGAYIDDFVPVGSGGLRSVEGMVFGPDQNLYVAGRFTNQVLRYDGTTGAFLGVFATSGNNGPIDVVFGPPIPEPNCVIALGVGTLSLIGRRRRRRSREIIPSSSLPAPETRFVGR